MKKQLFKILFIEFIIFVFAFINLIFKVNDYLFIILFALLSLVLSLFLKVDNRDSRFEKDYYLLIVIAVLFYYVITYFIGFFIGFIYSTYSKRLLGILKNIIINSSVLFIEEYLREKIVKSGKFYKTCLIFAPLVFTFIELVLIFSFNIFSSKTILMQFILAIFIPLLLKNVMLTFVCYYSNKKVCFLYQLLMALPNYVLGIFPDLGDYVNSTFLTIMPLIIMFFILKLKDTKREKIENGRVLIRRKRVSLLVLTFCMFFIGIMVYLVSGFGRFSIMGIGSGSMTGVINKGDAVIIDKDNHNYVEGQVIAFKMREKIIVHRIIKVEITDKGTFFRTKGDFNESEDGWILQESNIIGCVILKIPVIGWPSVILSELISR